MYEEALFIAFEMQSSPLLNYIRVIAKKQKNVIVESLVDFHKEK